MVDLDQASLFQLLPLRQVTDPTPWEVKPLITVIGENEFLILSWTGTSALGVFITGDGDPVRGTLEWAGYPKAVCESFFYGLMLGIDGKFFFKVWIILISHPYCRMRLLKCIAWKRRPLCRL